MQPLELHGVPYTSTAAPGGIAGGSAALRDAGLFERLAAVVDTHDAGDLDLEEPSGRRGASRLLNETALAHLFDATREAVAAAHEPDRLPLLVGGDCAALLGPLAALRDRHGVAALLMVDGHEDAWPPELSPTGEASDSEIAIALGLVPSLPGALAAAVPLVASGAVAMLGPRDAAELAAAGVPSLAGRLGLLLDDRRLRGGGVGRGIAEALTVVRRAAPAFWLHLDLDVLQTDDFPAADYLQPGGLRWDELRHLLAHALADERCAGLTVVIYNPDLDPDRSVAARVVEQLAMAVRAAASLGT